MRPRVRAQRSVAANRMACFCCVFVDLIRRRSIIPARRIRHAKTNTAAGCDQTDMHDMRARYQGAYRQRVAGQAANPRDVPSASASSGFKVGRLELVCIETVGEWFRKTYLS